MNSFRNHQRAFTLLELLISMMVFSILSVMAYSGLQIVIDTKNQTEKAEQRLVELQTAFMFIGRDIEQTINRSVRDGFGDERPALQGGEFGSELISLTRAGYTNFLNRQRSNLQRVAYRLDDDKLIRMSWPMLDQDYNQEPVERILVENVTKVEIRYLDQQQSLQDQWPPAFSEEGKQQLPLAVEIKLITDDMGEIRRLFRVAQGTVVG